MDGFLPNVIKYLLFTTNFLVFVSYIYIMTNKLNLVLQLFSLRICLKFKLLLFQTEVGLNFNLNIIKHYNKDKSLIFFERWTNRMGTWVRETGFLGFRTEREIYTPLSRNKKVCSFINRTGSFVEIKILNKGFHYSRFRHSSIVA
jgi:hypothetical protein